LQEREDAMMKYVRLTTILLVVAFTVGALISPNPATAASAAEIDRDAQKALGDLYAKSPSAKTMGEKAIGILVFPGIVKGGFIVGGQYGEGALIKDGKTVAYYNTVAASYGLQIGLQKFGYALFFMADSALKWLDKSDGWEIGVGPSIVVVDAGAAASMTSTTLQSDIYAFFFDQKGLMAGIGLQGTKITRLEK
jgi:lipid-binding SYLF domain-containing protein